MNIQRFKCTTAWSGTWCEKFIFGGGADDEYKQFDDGVYGTEDSFGQYKGIVVGVTDSSDRSAKKTGMKCREVAS